MITVTVLGLTLRQALAESEFQLEIAAPTTVKQLIASYPDQLGPLRSFVQKGELLVTVNKKVASLDTSLKDGDTVKLTHQFNPQYDGAMWQNP